MQNPTHNLRKNFVVGLGLMAAATLAAPVAQAQTYYYPAGGAMQAPAYYYSPATYAVQPTWNGYAPQTYQAGYSMPVYQATYTPQYYQPTYTQAAYTPTAVQPTATQPQYVPTSYVQPTTSAASPVTEAPASESTSAATNPTTSAPAASSGDPYGFTAWLNATRASYGLSPVGYDSNLENWAAMNSAQQASSGLGHFVMGPARRQNSAMGGYPGIETMWMNSPAHRAALLDPTIQWIGIAAYGAYWTFNAY